ncbi:MAG: diacylglycerol kinase family protein [Pirellulales bacterium]
MGRLNLGSEEAIEDARGDTVLIVSNPTAGVGKRGHLIVELAAQLESAGLQVQLIHDLAHFDATAERLHEAGRLRALVAAGGDGTVAEVANRTRPGMPITVFPLGTANLLAGYLGIGRDAAAVVRTIQHGRTRRLDAGLANGRLFLLMVGCGFDADVVHRLHRRRTEAGITYWTYARPILEAIRSYRYPRLRVYCEGAPAGTSVDEPIVARWAFVVNLPRYAGGLQFAPDALGDDGLLDVSTFRHGSLGHGLWYLGHVLLRRPTATGDFLSVQAKRVRIESDEAVPYQLDGDPGGTLPLDIEVVPGRLTVLAAPG